MRRYTSLKLPKNAEYELRVFSGCTGLTSITIPNGTERVPSFNNCSGLTSIIIPDSVTRIDGFSGCTGLTSITIPDKVTSIGSFSNCTGLTSITIPDKVTHIGNFSGCTGLTSITIPGKVTSIGSFSGCTGLTSITIPGKVTSIGSFSGCTGLTSITIPSSVTNIGENCFENCTGLTSVTILGGVKTIGKKTFAGCSNLTDVVISDSVTEINTGAFTRCTNLENVKLSENLTSIGDYAFYSCCKITDLTIPDSVTNIGKYAFKGCSKLRNITIPNSVTSIGDYAFVNMTIYGHWCSYAEQYATKNAESQKLVFTALEPPIEITSQPSAMTVTDGKQITFKVAAISNRKSTLAYQWQYSKDSGTTWTNSAQKTDTYSIPAQIYWNGWLYRCVITDTSGYSLTSDSVKLTVIQGPIVISTQPSATTIVDGQTLVFKIAAASNLGIPLSYQWQYSKNSGKSWITTTQESSIYTITARTIRNGWLYRCLVSDSEGNEVSSKAVKLTVLPVIDITTQPAAATILVGKTAEFKAEAMSNIGSTLTYQWQYSKDGGTIWRNSSQKTDTYTITARTTWNGWYYRCIVTDAKGNMVISDAVKLTVKPFISITTQPVAAKVTPGQELTFKVAATSNIGSTLTYQWQYSKDSGTTWTDSAQKTGTYSITAKSDWNGWKYRCMITDAAGNTVTSNAVKLTVKPFIAITTNPSDTTVTEGQTVTLHVAATSNIGSTLTYQWQYSKDSGTTWTDSAQKTSAYSITAKSDWNGWQYRCIVTDAEGNSKTSSAAKLTVQ